jgi:hypothetical protein
MFRDSGRDGQEIEQMGLEGAVKRCLWPRSFRTTLGIFFGDAVISVVDPVERSFSIERPTIAIWIAEDGGCFGLWDTLITNKIRHEAVLVFKPAHPLNCFTVRRIFALLSTLTLVEAIEFPLVRFSASAMTEQTQNQSKTKPTR